MWKRLNQWTIDHDSFVLFVLAVGIILPVAIWGPPEMWFG